MIQQELSEWTTNKVDRKVETPLLRPEWKLLGHIFFFFGRNPGFSSE